MTTDLRPSPDAGDAEAHSDAQIAGPRALDIRYEMQSHLNLMADAHAGLADVSAGRTKDARAALALLKCSRTIRRS